MKVRKKTLTKIRLADVGGMLKDKTNILTVALASYGDM